MEKRITGRPRGEYTPPPSKSLSHRAVLCAALAAEDGGSVIKNLGDSRDIDATLRAVRALGRSFRREGANLSVEADVRESTGEIDCGESGTTLRFVLPIAALEGRDMLFRGEGRLLQRPLAPYREALAPAGIRLCEEPGGIRMSGRLRSGVFHLPGDVSSQFISGLLLALPLLEGTSEIRLATPLESAPYVEMTMAVMGHFGVAVEQTSTGYLVLGGQRYRSACYTVEGDYSQAAYFLGAAALGCDLTCQGLPPNSQQGDRAILDILREMGATVNREGDRISVTADRLRPVTISARQIPDLIPPVAALCCFCEGESRIVDAGRLRFKESDRLHQLTRQLGALGADIREQPDGLTINGKPSLKV